jgi:hypothetical protein
VLLTQPLLQQQETELVVLALLVLQVVLQVDLAAVVVLVLLELVEQVAMEFFTFSTRR